MATTKEYKDFILEQLELLDNITCKAMMGEYLLYYNNILFGGIYDNRGYLLRSLIVIKNTICENEDLMKMLKVCI